MGRQSLKIFRLNVIDFCSELFWRESLAFEIFVSMMTGGVKIGIHASPHLG